MSEKKINTRVINKHDVESNWSKATGFIPKQGEIIVYDKDSTYDYVRVKVGDGTTVVSSLPFIDDIKVDKVDGKQLSTNDYTTAEKNKLAGIAEGANKTVVDSALSSTSTNPVQNKVVNTAISNLNTLVGDTSVSSQITSAIENKVDKVNGKGLSTNDYTTDEKNKLAGIASGAEVNQNAFSNVVVGSTTIAADSKTDSLTLVAGSNVTITPDATNDKVTIAATDTVYTHPSYTARTGVPTANATPAFGGTFNVSQPVSDATGHITAINNRTVTIPNTAATTSAAGLMSAADKTKLDGIATGADKTTVDSALSSTSINPVQNKVVNTAITNLNSLIGDTSVSSQISAAVEPKLDTADAAWVQVYDSGEITSEVNSISSINVAGYKSLVVAVKCVNTTNTTSTRSGAVIFTGSNSQNYAFNNIFSNLLKNGTTTSGAIAKFKIVDGFIICENALRAITADGMLSNTEGEGIDTLAPVSGGLIKCTSTVTTMAVSSAAQSAEHFYGIGSRVIVWGCKV